MSEPDYTALAERLDNYGFPAADAAAAAIRDLQERLARAEEVPSPYWQKLVSDHRNELEATIRDLRSKALDGELAVYEMQTRALAAERQRDEAVEVLREIDRSQARAVIPWTHEAAADEFNRMIQMHKSVARAFLSTLEPKP